MAGALGGLQDFRLAPEVERALDGQRVADMDESFPMSLVDVDAGATPGMARVHGNLTERICILRRLDFGSAERVLCTCDEHAAILGATLCGRADHAMMLLRAHIEASRSKARKITLHRLYRDCDRKQ